MCNYGTEWTPIAGSAKGAGGWIRVSRANVYLDHPSYTNLEHTLNIDFVDEAAGAAGRVAVELSPDSARALMRCIRQALRPRVTSQ